MEGAPDHLVVSELHTEVERSLSEPEEVEMPQTTSGILTIADNGLTNSTGDAQQNSEVESVITSIPPAILQDGDDLNSVADTSESDCAPVSQEPMEEIADEEASKPSATVAQKETETKPTVVRASDFSSLMILSIPNDSLHCVASFLSPTDWANFGQSSKAAHGVCGDVFRRVKMHGFRCATEVVTAWVSWNAMTWWHDEGALTFDI